MRKREYGTNGIDGINGKSPKRISVNSVYSVCSVFSLLLLLAGCGNRPARVNPANRVFVDGIGRSVAIKSDPRRVISLAPNLTEIFFALDLGDRIIGVTSYCDYPEAAKSKEKVGDTLRPNLERIIALKPDLVVVTTSSQLEDLTRKLDRLSIPVYVTNPRTVRDVIASIRNLGEIAGVKSKGEAVASEMERRIKVIENRVSGLPKPDVFYVLQSGPLITAGRNTFINDIINLAGGISISGQETADYPQFSRETVIARAPQAIVVPSSHGTDLVNIDDIKKEFSTTPAVRADRIIRVNPDWVDRPGPRLVDGVEQLAQGLHPENP